MNMNPSMSQISILSSIEIDVNSNKSIKGKYNHYNRNDRSKYLNDEKKDFRKELSSSLKRNKNDSKYNSSESSIKRKDTRLSKKGKEISSKEPTSKGPISKDREKSSESNTEKTDNQNRSDEEIVDANIANIDKQIAETLISTPKNTGKETDLENELIFTNKMQSKSTHNNIQISSANNSQMEDQTENASGKLPLMNKNVEGILSKNSKIIDSEKNKLEVNLKQPTEMIGAIKPAEIEEKVPQHSLKLEENKVSSEVKNPGVGKQVSVKNEKPLSPGTLDAGKPKQEKLQINKQTIEKLEGMQDNFGKEKASLENQFNSKVSGGNDVTLEKPANLNMVSNNNLHRIESDTITDTKKLLSGQKLLPNESMSKIVNKILFSVNNNKSEVKIDLRPDVLGDMRILITSDNNQLKISIAAETTFVKEVIENSLIQLKTDLQNNQLDVEKFDVFVGNAFEKDNPDKRESENLELLDRSHKQNELDDEQSIIESDQDQSLKINSGIGRIDYYA